MGMAMKSMTDVSVVSFYNSQLFSMRCIKTPIYPLNICLVVITAADN